MQFVPGELSHKILREARAQQEEVDAEEAGLGPSGRRTASSFILDYCLQPGVLIRPLHPRDTLPSGPIELAQMFAS